MAESSAQSRPVGDNMILLTVISMMTLVRQSTNPSMDGFKWKCLWRARPQGGRAVIFIWFQCLGCYLVPCCTVLYCWSTIPLFSLVYINLVDLNSDLLVESEFIFVVVIDCCFSDGRSIFGFTLQGSIYSFALCTLTKYWTKGTILNVRYLFLE